MFRLCVGKEVEIFLRNTTQNHELIFDSETTKAG